VHAVVAVVVRWSSWSCAGRRGRARGRGAQLAAVVVAVAGVRAVVADLKLGRGGGAGRRSRRWRFVVVAVPVVAAVTAEPRGCDFSCHNGRGLSGLIAVHALGVGHPHSGSTRSRSTLAHA
jgi:hypothetical protein